VTVGAGGVITIAYGLNVNNVINGQTLALTPYTSTSGDISWQCGNKDLTGTGTLVIASGAAVPANGGTLIAKYRPANCRP
jgi:hypothetical protein